MSIQAIGGVAEQSSWVGAAPTTKAQESQQAQSAPKNGDPQKTEELTTVTTNCPKKHWHDQSCPHTTVTRPAPKQGAPGYLLDEKA